MEPKLSHSLAKFAFNFCNELDRNKTTICSPLSAEILLAMTALGCKGQSHAELMAALDISDDEAIRSSFAYVTSTFQKIEDETRNMFYSLNCDVTLNMANKIYIKKDGELKTGFKKDAEEVFNFTPEQLDFNESEAAAGIINQWAAEKTNGLIKEVISAEKLDHKTGIILVNAVYFKGNWEVQFMSTNTANRNFHVNNTTLIKVPMMYKSGKSFKYGVIPQLGATMLSMKYQGIDASMVIVLPDEIEGLNSVIQQLANGYDLMDDIENLKTHKTDVMIPKFKAEMTVDLKELLPKMGIKSIFDEESEINVLTSNKRLFVSQAVQKAYIVVDEKGTEAAAVTAFGYMLCSARRLKPPKRFFANRPFLYLLVVRSVPIFVGVYEGSQYAVPSSPRLE